MTIAEAVLEYRKKNKVSQRELAKLFGVTDYVIHRIESGQTFRLTPSVREGLMTILTDAQIRDLDDTNPSVVQLKYTGSAAINSRSTAKIKVKARENLKQLEVLGYSVKNGYEVGRTIFDLQVRNQEKIWYIDFSGCEHYDKNDSRQILDRIWRAYGAAPFYGTNKLSIVFKEDISDTLNREHDIIFPKNFSFDVSILYYNDALSRIDKEVILYQAPNGMGFYNFDSPESRDRNQHDFIQWMFLLSQGFLNEPIHGTTLGSS